MKSNGWTDGRAALQLFAHLDGEALIVVFVMPEEERAKWEGLSQGLSDYYYSPGRLAVFWRQFKSAIPRPGMDPATFAIELECGLLRETRDGPGGRVSLPDHRGSRYNGPRRGSWWIEERSAGMAVAGGVWARTRLGFEHTGFSATGEPSHGSSWTG